MNSFTYVRARNQGEALSAVKEAKFSLPVLKGGGLDLVDQMKEGLIAPDALIDVRGVRGEGDAAAGAPDAVEMKGDVIRFPAAMTLAQAASSAVLRKFAPVVAMTAGSAATPAVRNVATVAGNLLQRPRCWYYRNSQFNCLKKGGSTCFAVEGENAYHAIFSPGPCHIVHPSNMAPALMVCGAVVHTAGNADRKEIPIAKLFHGPDKGVTSEHTLEAGELITHVTMKARPMSGFYAVKEKQSFDWPLVFACVAVDMEGERIGKAEVVAGAVAPVPWALPAVGAALKGVDPKDERALTEACAQAGKGAKPMRDNGYKVGLLGVAVKRAVMRAVGLPIAGEEGR